MRVGPELGFFFSLFRRRKGGLALSVILSCIQSLSLLPIALLVNRAIDEAIPEGDAASLLTVIVQIALLALAGGLVQLANRRVTIGGIKAAVAELRAGLVKAQLQGSRKYYSKEDLDTLHSRIVQDSFRVDSMAGALFTQTVPGALISAGLFIVLLRLNPLLSLVCAAAAPLFAAGVLAMSRRLKALIKTFHADFTRFSKGVKFVLANNELIRISTAETFEEARQRATIQDLRTSHGAALWYSALLHVGQQELLMLSGAVILLIGGYSVIRKQLTLGELIAFYAALGLLNSYARSAIDSVPSIVEGLESLRVLRGIMEEAGKGREAARAIAAGEAGAGDAGAAAEPEGGGNGFGVTRSIAFEGVSFAYAGTEPSVFLIDGVDFSIRIDRNEIITIHGLSGSGKTTLMYLILGFYKPGSGRILVDGIDLREIPPAPYRRQIGVVLQDPLIFAGTVRENIVYGLETWTEEALREACAEAMILEDILQWEKGFETAIGEFGMTLSGGQRQRLAIARALLRKPRLLILDEPTNHLDESLIESMSRLWSRADDTAGPGRACIVISHDKILRTLADASYELKDGKLYRD